MSAGMLSIKGIVGIALTIFGLSTFLYSFQMQLLFEELLMPRLSQLLFIIGGIIIFTKDLFRSREEDVNLDRDFTFFSVIAVGFLMYIYYMGVLHIGMVVATSLTLTALWFLIEYLDSSRRDRDVKLSQRLLLSLVISASITALLYGLFVVFLDIYFPPNLLF
ncbi:tripartite tricarboxylate transporter TctB family protein [Halarsenatibacter silvermanii]|uniref:Tripartite tricarboxylate transporter TctB family protein n=1 Tax=Halarsenatibacter silvermanii TaxID=321763 RepID=A0A1G9J1W6_9FIRM|nr:tripartite tricarboxylate transporter TctB family protein [Halarsenatibacter silvermanii]SDL31302.1 Tripartite tricarboxylate transporter TctB family protein [Halarsenatibacter silvermanii]